MGSEQQPPPPGPPRRPFCSNCSKPARLCLCSRLRSPPLENSTGVTILQHSVEKDHPLNSTRVAKLGLKNLVVVPVTDVNFQAQFLIRPLDRQKKPEAIESQDFAATGDDIGDNSNQRASQSNTSVEINQGTIGSDVITDHSSLRRNCKMGIVPVLELNNHQQSAFFPSSGCKILDFDCNGDCSSEEADSVTVRLPKYTVTCSSRDIKIVIEKTVQPKINWFCETPIGKAAISHGFVVKKLQRKQLKGCNKFQDFMEFEIVVPPGAALLYPSAKSVSLKAVDFQVNHLVVLDGTWAKANRMYHENPWLQLLPHLKLDAAKESLYSGVRQQPKTGCLSTIESIICTLKELGEDEKGLDRLLGVFDSMIEDQRRCKEEKFKALSEQRES